MKSGMSPVTSTERLAALTTSAWKRRKTNQRLKTDDEKDEEIACIFKTHDDIRKDNLSLQVIKMFQEAFRLERLDVYVFPYLTISTRTGNEKILGGIIQVVPNTFSRDQIGKENKYSLYEFFKEKYGGEMSPLFQKARENFIKSMAAYSVVSYILQLKDRHNGNIIIDNLGHLIHIDFGFIFDISPGKNMKFENAEFKLTQYFRLK
jgi:phosphatidylinositol 4-kinase